MSTQASASARFSRSAQRLIRHFAGGHTVTLRRRSTLSDRSTGKAPSLLVNGLTPIDSGTISLYASSLSGTLVAGTEFQIAGDGFTYTAQSDVPASGDALADVPIDPALGQAAADDAAVTITSAYGDTEVSATITRFADELIDDSRIKATDRLVVVDVLELGITVDMTTQVIVGSRVYQMKEILPVQPGLEKFAMRLHVGSR